MNAYRDQLRALAERARALRLLQALKQQALAARAGIGVMTLRRFEKTGRTSTENVLRIAAALGAAEAFDRLFEPPQYRTLDEALARPAALQRKRVRRP